MVRNLALLGSTGSIGRQTLDVVRDLSPAVQVVGLAAHRNTALLMDQAREFEPELVVSGVPVADRSGLEGACYLLGDSGMTTLATANQVDLVVVATTGKAGLLPTLAALRAGKLVALANKETLVMAGPLIRRELSAGHGTLVPIDSEHSAIWQCLQGEEPAAVERLTLTASGGALRDLSGHDLDQVTPQQALAHPNWSMGRKITVDSANLMNKGLEVLEAQWLFDLPLDRIDVVLHRESIVHSLVDFVDGSTKAQLGLPDMRLPIQYALSHPQRWPNRLTRLNLADVGVLHFDRVAPGQYPALDIALAAGRRGGTYPAVLSAADEVAVDAFLAGRIAFTAIPTMIMRVLDAHSGCTHPSLEDILSSDVWARQYVARLIAS